MVKVCILSPDLPLETQQIAASLRDHQVEVVVYSRRGTEAVEGTDHRTPFKQGTLWEGLRALPALIQERAPIFHFILGPGETLPAGFHALAPILSALPGSTVMTTSFDERHFSRKREKLLLQWADIATFVSRDHLLQVQRDLGSRRASTRFEVLRPPPLALAERQPLSYDLEKLVLKLGNFVLWPEPPKKPELINEFLAAGWGSLQRSPRFDSRSPGFFSGAISAGEWQSLAARSGALVTAGLSLHANQLIEIQTLANHHQIPLIVDPSQSRRVPGLVREGSTGWTVHSAQSLRDLMEKNSRLQCEGPFSESISREMDLVVNELMRCYRSQP